MVARGGVPPLSEQEGRFAGIFRSGPGDYIRRQRGNSVVIHLRHSRSRLQLTGRVQIHFTKNHPSLITEAVKAGEAIGFEVVNART